MPQDPQKAPSFQDAGKIIGAPPSWDEVQKMNLDLPVQPFETKDPLLDPNSYEATGILGAIYKYSLIPDAAVRFGTAAAQAGLIDVPHGLFGMFDDGSGHPVDVGRVLRGIARPEEGYNPPVLSPTEEATLPPAEKERRRAARLPAAKARADLLYRATEGATAVPIVSGAAEMTGSIYGMFNPLLPGGWITKGAGTLAAKLFGRFMPTFAKMTPELIKRALTTGTGFGLYSGVTNEYDDKGRKLTLGERVLHGMAEGGKIAALETAVLPLVHGISRWIAGDSAARKAIYDYAEVNGMPRSVTETNGDWVSRVTSKWAQDGMPGVAMPKTRQFLGAAAEVVGEGAAWSMIEPEFWAGMTDAWNGYFAPNATPEQRAAAKKGFGQSMEILATNILGMGMLRVGNMDKVLPWRRGRGLKLEGRMERPLTAPTGGFERVRPSGGEPIPGVDTNVQDAEWEWASQDRTRQQGLGVNVEEVPMPDGSVMHVIWRGNRAVGTVYPTEPGNKGWVFSIRGGPTRVPIDDAKTGVSRIMDFLEGRFREAKDDRRRSDERAAQREGRNLLTYEEPQQEPQAMPQEPVQAPEGFPKTDIPPDLGRPGESGVGIDWLGEIALLINRGIDKAVDIIKALRAKFGEAWDKLTGGEQARLIEQAQMGRKQAPPAEVDRVQQRLRTADKLDRLGWELDHDMSTVRLPESGDTVNLDTGKTTGEIGNILKNLGAKPERMSPEELADAVASVTLINTLRDKHRLPGTEADTSGLRVLQSRTPDTVPSLEIVSRWGKIYGRPLGSGGEWREIPPESLNKLGETHLMTDARSVEHEGGISQEQMDVAEDLSEWRSFIDESAVSPVTASLMDELAKVVASVPREIDEGVDQVVIGMESGQFAQQLQALAGKPRMVDRMLNEVAHIAADKDAQVAMEDLAERVQGEWTPENVKAAFDLTDEQTVATMALAEMMGLDTKKLTVTRDKEGANVERSQLFSEGNSTRKLSSLGFYDNIREAIAAAPKKATQAEWMAILKKVKGAIEEAKYIGLLHERGESDVIDPAGQELERKRQDNILAVLDGDPMPYPEVGTKDLFSGKYQPPQFVTKAEIEAYLDKKAPEVYETVLATPKGGHVKILGSPTTAWEPVKLDANEPQNSYRIHSRLTGKTYGPLVYQRNGMHADQQRWQRMDQFASYAEQVAHDPSFADLNINDWKGERKIYADRLQVLNAKPNPDQGDIDYLLAQVEEADHFIAIWTAAKEAGADIAAANAAGKVAPPPAPDPNAPRDRDAHLAKIHASPLHVGFMENPPEHVTGAPANKGLTEYRNIILHVKGAPTVKSHWQSVSSEAGKSQEVHALTWEGPDDSLIADEMQSDYQNVLTHWVSDKIKAFKDRGETAWVMPKSPHPDIPITDWHGLIAKMMLYWMAKGGYKRFAWSKGVDVAERWNEARYVKSMTWDGQTLHGIRRDGAAFSYDPDKNRGETLRSYVASHLADRLEAGLAATPKPMTEAEWKADNPYTVEKVAIDLNTQFQTDFDLDSGVSQYWGESGFPAPQPGADAWIVKDKAGVPDSKRYRTGTPEKTRIFRSEEAANHWIERKQKSGFSEYKVQNSRRNFTIDFDPNQPLPVVGKQGKMQTYDKKFGSVIGALVKGGGGKVTEGRIPGMSRDMNIVENSPELTEHLLKGMPLFSDERAGVRFARDGQALIQGFQNPNVVDGVHELLHVARRNLLDYSIPAEQRAGITDDDIAKAAKWAGADGPKGWTRTAEEKLARGWTEYLREGKAPIPELQGIFDKLRDWLVRFYQKIRGKGVKLNADIRSVFDKLVQRGDVSSVLKNIIDRQAKMKADKEALRRQREGGWIYTGGDEPRERPTRQRRTSPQGEPMSERATFDALSRIPGQIKRLMRSLTSFIDVATEQVLLRPKQLGANAATRAGRAAVRISKERMAAVSDKMTEILKRVSASPLRPQDKEILKSLTRTRWDGDSGWSDYHVYFDEAARAKFAANIDDLAPETRQWLNDAHDMFIQAGRWMEQSRARGGAFHADPGRWRLTRHMTQIMFDAVRIPGNMLRQKLVDELVRLHGADQVAGVRAMRDNPELIRLVRERFAAQIHGMSAEEGTNRAFELWQGEGYAGVTGEQWNAMLRQSIENILTAQGGRAFTSGVISLDPAETLRSLTYFPDRLRVGGKEIEVLESHPFRHLSHMMRHAARRSAFREAFPTEGNETSQLAAFVNHIRTMANNPQREMAASATEDLIRVLNGIPIQAKSQFTPDPDSWSYPIARALGGLMNLYRGSLLSAAFIPNIPEPLGAATDAMGAESIGKGYKRFSEALAASMGGNSAPLTQLSRELAEAGVTTRDVFNWEVRHANKLDTWEDVTRLVAKGLSIGMHWVQEANEMIVGMAALDRVAQMRAGHGSQADAEMLRQMGFDTLEAQAMLRGEGPAESYKEYQLRAVAHLMGGTSATPAERTKLEHSRTWRLLTSFTNYAMRRASHLTNVFGNAGNKSLDWLADPTNQAAGQQAGKAWLNSFRAAGFLVAGGVLAQALREFFRDGTEGVAQLVRDTMADPVKEMVDAGMSNVASGPSRALWAGLTGTDREVGRAMMNAVLPVSAGRQIMELFSDDSRLYAGMDWFDRAVTFGTQVNPLAKAATAGMFGLQALALGRGRDHGLDVALRTYYDARRDTGKFPAQDPQTREEIGQEFWEHMVAASRLAAMGKLQGDPQIQEHLRQALKLKDASAVQASLRGHSTITSPEFKRWTQEERDHLRARLGPEGWRRLEQFDALLKAIGR